MALALALVALLAGLSACEPGRPSAGSVEGRGISARMVDDYVRATAKVYRKQGQDLTGKGEGTYKSGVSSGVLQQLVLLKAAEVLARRRGLELTKDLRATGKKDIDTVVFGEQQAELGAQVNKEISADTRSTLVELTAWRAALLADLATEDPETRARQAYDDNPLQFASEICMDGLIVADQAGLDAAQARLDAGETLAEISTEESVVPEIRAAKGQFACGSSQDLQNDFPEPVLTALFAAGEGEIAGPFQGQEGRIILLEVSKVTPAPFADVREQIVQNLGPAGTAELTRLLRQELPDLDVQVDPRFGRWSPANGQVLAPKAPSPPAGTPTTTAPAGATPSGG